MKRGGSNFSSRLRTSFVAALQAKNEHILSCCAHYKTYRAFDLIYFAFEELLFGFLRSDSQQGDHCNDMFIVMVGPVVAQIWSFEFVRHSSMFA